jgi:hypothetical protein
MSQTIVNLTLTVVQSAIDDVLSHYDPPLLHRSQVKTKAFKEQLATFVMRRVPLRYITLEAKAACDLSSTPNCYSNDQQQQIQQLIYQGIQTLLTANVPALSPDRIAEHSPVEPSMWFG